MNILLCGDVVGRSGRDAVKTRLPQLKRDLAIDVAIVNAENAAAGFGLTERLAGELYDAGADILTTGNHVWDQRELIPYIPRDQRLLRRPISRKGRRAPAGAGTGSTSGAACSSST